MIRAEHLVLEYPTFRGPRRVLDDISFHVAPGEKLAVLGRNGAGKSSLIKMMGGVVAPTAGAIKKDVTVSWPIGFSGGFHPNLTGRDNIRFIARLYDQPFDDLYAFTEDFAELGEQMKLEVGAYSTGMKARLAIGLSLGVEFDCYLVDEVIAAGDPGFQTKCRVELLEKRRDRSLILASHDTRLIAEYCTHALVLKNGRGKVFRDLSAAIDIYQGL